MHLLTPSLPHTRPFCSYIMLAFIHTLLMSAFLVRIYVMWAIIARYFQKFTVRSLGHAQYGRHAFWSSAMAPLTQAITKPQTARKKRTAAWIVFSEPAEV